MSEENKILLRRLVDEVYNQQNIDVIDQLFAADHGVDKSRQTFSGLPSRLEGTKQAYRMLFTTFPDLEVTILDMASEGEKIMAYKKFQGTHKGTCLGVAPTGAQIKYHAVDIFRIVDGKFKEHWGVADKTEMMKQLGIIKML